MGTPAPARECPRCRARSDIDARFCATCGNDLRCSMCVHCGQPLQDGARFCVVCGTSVLDANKGMNATSLDSVIAALEMALGQADPMRGLHAATDCLNKEPSVEQAAIASLVSMSCYARLDRFEEAREQLISARGFYSDHLGLVDQQRATFLQDGCFVGDLQAAGNRDLQDNPWLYFILGHAYGPLLYETNSLGERRIDALRAWGEFISDNCERMFGMLALLYLTNHQNVEAASYLERVLLIARRYHAVQPLRIELLWPRVVLGDCYWASDQKEKAVAKWRSASSLEVCMLADSPIDDWGRFGLPWIEAAKARLLGQKISIPTLEVSRKASEHLKQAVAYVFEAEQFEARGQDLEELSNLIRRAGRKYTAPLERATHELAIVEQLDPFSWAKSPNEETFYWYNYENAKGFVLQKTAFAQLANEKLVSAIASLKQAMDFWPALSFCALIAGLQAACGLFSDARVAYQMCIDRAEELGAVESLDDRKEILLGVREGLNGLPA